MNKRRIIAGFVLCLMLGCAPASPEVNPPTPTPAAAATSTNLPTETPFAVVAPTASWTPSPPRATVAKVIQLAVGESHSCALSENGLVECWGKNDHGQLGDGTTVNREKPELVKKLDHVRAISAGWGHTCALTFSDGVFCWGYGKNGELGNGKETDSALPVKAIGLSANTTSIAAGDDHTCAIVRNKGVYCWGFNETGQLGNGNVNPQPVPVKVVGLQGEYGSLAAGWGHTCALSQSGGVVCWGDNKYGQLGNNSELEKSVSPVDVTGLTSGTIAIAAKGGHTCALTSDRQVACWGNNAYGELGDGTSTMHKTPVSVAGLPDDMDRVVAGWNYSCAVTHESNIYCWGRNTYGQLGDGTQISQLRPIRISGIAGQIAAVDLGWRHSCIADQTGGVRCWGANESGQLRDDSPSSAFVAAGSSMPSVLSIVSAPIAAGGDHTCVLNKAGGVLCWGWNFNGQLGDGTSWFRYNPVQVMGLESGVVAIAAGGNHTCAIRMDGAVFCWGANYAGALGDGTNNDSLIPVAVKGLPTGAIGIAAGNGHSCALLQDGKVMCWGSNSHGQLGLGSSSLGDSESPAAVRGLPEDVRSISSLSDHTCALNGAGAVYCWGLNDHGQLGNGTTGDAYEPISVSGLSKDVTAIAAGGSHTCAIVKPGKVMCWGRNTYDQLGIGAMDDQYLPIPVAMESGTPIRITAGFSFTCLYSLPQGVECWGNGDKGQLGNGGKESGFTPASVHGLGKDIRFLQAGDRHTCAMMKNGDLFCWGANNFGQLGNGSVMDSTFPRQVDFTR